MGLQQSLVAVSINIPAGGRLTSIGLVHSPLANTRPRPASIHYQPIFLQSPFKQLPFPFRLLSHSHWNFYVPDQLFVLFLLDVCTSLVHSLWCSYLFQVCKRTLVFILSSYVRLRFSSPPFISHYLLVRHWSFILGWLCTCYSPPS